MTLYWEDIREEIPEGCPYMEFRLIYEGSLRSGGGGGSGGKVVNEKHAIRKAIHKQLIKLWDVVPDLKMRTKEHSQFSVAQYPTRSATGQRINTFPAARPTDSLLETLGNKHNKCNYKFVPLVNEHLKLSCGLEILLLYRERLSPIGESGDIDNRLKTLFDALQIPHNCDHIPKGAIKDADEEPYFFCLLEDDKLITDVKVTTDKLLTPFPMATGEPGCNHPENFVHLVISVKIRPSIFSYENLAFVP
jgi:hypothetical protein